MTGMTWKGIFAVAKKSGQTILVYEWVTGGGLAGSPLPGSWAAEGRAMRRAIAADFASFFGPLELVKPGIGDGRTVRPGWAKAPVPSERDCAIIVGIARVPE